MGEDGVEEGFAGGGEGEVDEAPVAGGFAPGDEPFGDEELGSLADGGAADLAGFGDIAHRGEAFADVTQDMELLDADAELLAGDGAHIAADDVPDAGDGVPELVDGVGEGGVY